MQLSSLGWDVFFANHFQPYFKASLVPARVALEHKHAYRLLAAAGEFSAVCTGNLLHTAAARADLPAVGDWVAIRPRTGEAHADIHAVLPRKTKFSRRAAGDGEAEQIVAANVDTVFLVTALDHNYNLRRIERYLAVAWESGAQPVIVLNKADLHPDPAAAQAEVESVAVGAPVLALSTLHPVPASVRTHAPGLAPALTSGPMQNHGPIGPWFCTVEQALERWLVPGGTVAFLGSTGVGKSTLINRLMGEERQVTAALSAAVGKGRHTTTHRELIVAPSGVLVIDTPGMRELQLWDLHTGTLDTTFADIAALAARCRFRDCTHRAEPGCAVQSALGDGSLDFDRWQSFQKLQREQAHAARKADPRLARETKAGWKKINKAQRAMYRMKRGGDN